MVLHLRSLIEGQTHHMEHIVHSLNQAPELSDYIEEGYEDAPEDTEDHDSLTNNDEAGQRLLATPLSRASNTETGEPVNPEMESRFFIPPSPGANGRSGSRLSIADVADRHIREKTDAIAYIIRNISDQCAAAVEGLQLAQTAESHEDTDHEQHHLNPELSTASTKNNNHKHTHSDDSNLAPSDAGDIDLADSGHGGSSGFLTPHDENRSHSRQSSLPPTPDLVGGGGLRSSTSMSGYSASTAPTTQGRDSQQWGLGLEGKAGVKIVEADESVRDDGSEMGGGMEREEVRGKGSRVNDSRPVGGRVVM